ncbi:urea transporter [Mucilaginibacter ginkgonis]|uniref:urea transporter n=1 Tax=Mucilaginibacter ginkgonis TaxID=2682091 RepID=UPI001FC7C2C0|nr:urea transporter [Mucilaginibacter ginkgonis]
MFGFILLCVSILNPVAGLCGFAGVLFSLIMAQVLGFDQANLRTGVYSFNSLLLGLAFGSFYHINTHFILWYLVASLMVVLLSGILVQRLAKVNLPILSLPFIVTFWIVLAAANSIFNTGLLQKDSALLQEIYTGQNKIGLLHQYLCDAMPGSLCLYFRSLSAVLFQCNVITGIGVALGLLIHSRIGFTLSVTGFLTAIAFNSAFHIYPDGVSYYHLGANFIMATIAIGSFFLIPSWRSYLCAVISIPALFLLVNALSTLLGLHSLPVFSLPFCIVNFALLYFVKSRQSSGKPQPVVVQHYSPERNLYQFINQKKRLARLDYFPLVLPFMGRWTVSQGYNGSITHLGDWGHALDFVITDSDGNTYKYPGIEPGDFYCYNKPVLACGDGVIEAVVNHIEDNIIGEVNLTENWGNTVVIKHIDGLYSKVSHLKKDSIAVKVGQWVSTGDLLGLCGNSGRSPEPHLHFQVQATPYIGSKTLAYPLAVYEMVDEGGVLQIASTATPIEGCHVNNFLANASIKKAFDFQPGYVAKMKSAERTETIESVTNGLYQNYLYSRETGAAAYFINNGNRFYFTSFNGDKGSLLYQFYLTAFNVWFREQTSMTDHFPLVDMDNTPAMWLQDIVAPFFIFNEITHHSQAESRAGELVIHSERIKNGSTIADGSILINGQRISSFTSKNSNNKIHVEWLTGNM